MAKTANEPDLGKLKDELLDYLRTTGCAIFYSVGMPHDEGYIYWDVENYPDWRQFVDVGRESGARMFLLTSSTFAEEELLSALEMLEDSELEDAERDDPREFLESVRPNIGHGSWVRIAWQQDGRRFAFERVALWYERFLDLLTELSGIPESGAGLEDDDDESGDGRGFYSLN